MQSQLCAGCHQSPSWVRGDWSVAAVAASASATALACCRRRQLQLHGAHHQQLSPEEMESLWDPKRSGAEAEEGRAGGLGGELVANRAKRQERKRQELLALALGVKLGSKGNLLWKPIKILASCPQISSPPVRRSALRETPEKQCFYEKMHNFKVRGLCFVQS